jgi:hypothetical protein
MEKSTRSTTCKENDGQEKKKDAQVHYLFIVIFFYNGLFISVSVIK